MAGIRKSMLYWIILISVEAALLHSQEPCPVDKFGLACQFDCHCQRGCGENFTKCEGDCNVDWSGPTCQIHKLSVNQKLANIRNPGLKYPASYAERTVDGNISSCIHANATGGTERLRIELSSIQKINEIRIINTQKLSRQERSWIKDMEIRVGNLSTISKGKICSTYKDKFPETKSVTIQCKETGKFIWFIKRSTPYRFLSMCEVQFFGTDCNIHTWGEDCRKFCGRCAGGVSCDVVTGKCPQDRCDVGWTGIRCNKEIPQTTSIGKETTDTVIKITTPSMSTILLTSTTEWSLSKVTVSTLPMMTYAPESRAVTSVQKTTLPMMTYAPESRTVTSVQKTTLPMMTYAPQSRTVTSVQKTTLPMMTYAPQSRTVTSVQETNQYSTVPMTADTNTVSLSTDMSSFMTTDLSQITPALCDLKIDLGQSCSQGNGNGQLLWRYYFEEGVCFPGIYLGCGGNLNRFLNRRECESTCFPQTTVKPIVTSDGKILPWISKDEILSSSTEKNVTKLDSSYETRFMDSLITERNILQMTESMQYDTVFSDYQSIIELDPLHELFYTSFSLDASTSSTESKLKQLDSSHGIRFTDSLVTETNLLPFTESLQYDTVFADDQSSIERDPSHESSSTSFTLYAVPEKEVTQMATIFETSPMESSTIESARLDATESIQRGSVFRESSSASTEIETYTKYFTSNAFSTITPLVSPSANMEDDNSILHHTSSIKINPSKSFSSNTGQWQRFLTATGTEMSHYVEKGYKDSIMTLQGVSYDAPSDYMYGDSIPLPYASSYLVLPQGNTMRSSIYNIYSSMASEPFYLMSSDFEHYLELDMYTASTVPSQITLQSSQHVYPSTTVSSTFQTDVERLELHPPKMSSAQIFSFHMMDSSSNTDHYKYSSTTEGETSLTSYFVTTDNKITTPKNQNTTRKQANTDGDFVTDRGISATTVITTVVPVYEVQAEATIFTVTNIVPILVALSGAILISLLLIILIQRHNKKKQSFELNNDFINYSTKEYELKPKKVKLTARDDGVRDRMLSLRPMPQPKITLTETEISISSENEVTIPLQNQDSEEYPNIQYIDV